MIGHHEAGPFTRPHRIASVLAVAALVAGCERRASRSWHETPPIIRVASRDTAIRTIGVGRIIAPQIAFNALVYPDSIHLLPVVTEALGAIVTIDSARPVRDREPVALLRTAAGATHTTRAPAPGLWRPRRLQGQVVASGDTIGTLLRRDLWLAVGAVGELEQGVIHPGDSAEIMLGAGRLVRRGHVEQVYRPGARYPYSAEIVVEFTGPSPLASDRVSVVIHPSHAHDSLLGLPREAIVHLEGTPAVFIALDSGRYELAWITTGPAAGTLVTLRSDHLPGRQVVISGILPLAVAAAESLAARRKAQ